MLKRRTVDNQKENITLTSLIVSTEVLKQVIDFVNPKWFKSPYSQKIAKWCLDYYKIHREAPQENILNIYRIESEKLKEEEADLIAEFLDSLSNDFEKKNYNAQHALDICMDFFKERSASILAETIQSYVLMGKTGEEITNLIGKHKLVSKQTTSFKDVSDRNIIEGVLEKYVLPDEDNPDILFSFPGEAGKYMKPFTRNSFTVFMGSMKKGKCVHGDSQITLSNGECVKISEIYKNKKELLYSVSFNEKNKKFEKSKILDCLYQGKQNVYELITRTGRSIKLTNNHPLLTVDGWKELKELKKGDFICLPKTVDFFGTKVLEDYKIKLLSYIIADGCTRGGSCTFIKGEKAIVGDFSNCVSFFDCRTTVRNKITVAVVNGVNSKHKHNSNHVCAFLKKHNLWNVCSHEKEIPLCIFSLKKENIALFLRTLFTCDGSVYSGIIEYCTSSEKLIKGIHFLLTKFGIISKINFKENGKKGAWYLTIKDYENFEKFYKFIGLSFSKENSLKIQLEKKQKVYRSFFDKIPHKVALNLREDIRGFCLDKGLPLYKTVGEKAYNQFSGLVNTKRSIMRQTLFSLNTNIPCVEKCLQQDIFWDSVNSIELFGTEDTYDLCIENNHNFIANNILVHNSWILEEVAHQGVLAGLNVAVFNLEMNEDKYLSTRVYKRMLAKDKKERIELFPVFDCLHNLHCDCPLGSRNGVGISVQMSMLRDSYDLHHLKYVPCTKCRFDKKGHYRVSTWFEERKIEIITKKDIDYIENIFRYSHGELFFKGYPMGTATVSRMKDDLAELEYEQDKLIDLAVFDYSDIIASEISRGDKFEETNEKWIALKSLADEKHISVVSGTQTNRQGINRSSVEESDTSENIKKLAHVDDLFTLNSTEEERRNGILRMSKLVSRWGDVDKAKQCMFLQNLNVSQPMLDTQIVWLKKEK